jgi:acetone carboxylase gamma subunit
MPGETKKAILSKEGLKDLIEGRLDPESIKQIIRKPKDPERFEMMLEIEQERVPWEDKILLPLQEHLYVVQKGKERIVKCSCGHEFGDYRKNWKFSALVYERNPADGEVFRGPKAADPEWMILREFYCPGCFQQLDVEAVPHGYPILFNFLPDIDGFYDQRRKLKKRVMGK